MSLWRLEWLRLVRTKRIIALVGVYLFFGLLGPFTARYLGEIVESFGGDVTVTFPPPVPSDGLAQYLANAAQIGLLVAVVIAAGSLAFDAKPEMGIFLRTRTENIMNILLPRLVVTAAAVSGAYVLGVLAAWYESAVLIGPLPAGDVLVGTIYGVLWLVFVVAVVAAAAGRTSSVLGAAGVAIVALLILPIVGIADAIGQWLPSHLVGALEEMAAGRHTAVHYLRATAVTAAAIPALLWLAVTGASRREL